MILENIIGRFDEDNFQKILGKEVIETLNALGTEYVYQENLLKVLTNSLSHYELLDSDFTRNIIIDSLYENEIHSLIESLQIPPGSDIYDTVKNIPFNKHKTAFYNFFELQVPEIEEIKEWETEIEILPAYPLYEYQNNVLKKINTILSSDKNRVLLHMPTGSGKTRTAITYICHHLIENENTNVVWFANTKELLEQAASEFIKAWHFLGNREIKVVKFWDKTNIDLTKIKGAFIVAGLDKTYNYLMNSIANINIFAKNCSLVIMDEAHMAIAPTYQLLLENLLVNNSTSLIGLSATPGRTWNNPEEDQKLANFFFRQKAILEISGYENPVDYLTENGFLAKVKNTKLLNQSGIKLSEKDIEYLKKNYVLPARVLETISEDKLRNMAIISKIKELVLNHERIILFAISKKHAENLNNILVAIGINSKVVTSSTNALERKQKIDEFKTKISDSPESQVLCNYGILTTGFDAPETSCALIARPTDSLVLYSQMVGRAIRGKRSGGNEEAEIVTVIDENLSGFNNVADAFLNWEDVWE